MAKARIYQVKITLQGSKPPIWRRVLLSEKTTLALLHDIIQHVMGWWDSHLHHFNVGGVYYGIPDYDDYYEGRDERQVTLGDVAREVKNSFVYEYDFGDSWEHLVEVEKILPDDPAQQLPFCLTGKRACPPEDVGGIWGYYMMLEALEDADHPDYEMYLEWIDDDFDPDEFDLESINKALRKLS